MDVSIISKTEAVKLAKKTGKLYVMESPNDNAVMFTNAPGIPINNKLVTNLEVVVYNFPTQIHEHDPREHKKIKDINTFLQYYYGKYDLIESV